MSSIKKLYKGYIRPVLRIGGGDHIISEIGWWWKLKQHPGVETISINNVSAKFNITNRSEYNRFYTSQFEREILEDIVAEARGDDVVFDVGANIGTYTCLLSQKVTNGQVVAFEPYPENTNALRTNIELNGSPAIVDNRALADRNGKEQLAVVSDAQGSGQHVLSSEQESNSIVVPVVTGDEIVNRGEYPIPSVIKIDVEGAEGRVLSGLESTLSKPECRLVYVEIHPDRLSEFEYDEAEIYELIEGAGFSIEVIKERSDEYFLKGRRNEIIWERGHVDA